MLAGMHFARGIRGHVRHELAFTPLRRKRVQETANIDFVSCLMAADSMSINGDAHELLPV